MEPAAFEAFTDRLVERWRDDGRVVGLVLLGSASGEPAPDRWSDHDLFAVVEPAERVHFRAGPWWLPDAERVVWWHRETEHAIAVVYDEGHLVEAAVFSLDELAVARVNRARVVLDKGGVASALERVRAATAAAERPDDRWLVGQVVVSLVVACGRWGRGERLSAHRRFVDALGHTARLVHRHLPAAPGTAARPDGLDPFRRVEATHPVIGAELGGLVRLPVPDGVAGLVALLRRELASSVLDDPRVLTVVDLLAADARS